MLERRPPDDPREWLNRAYSNLKLAKMKAEGIYLEELCFHTQQAAEKAIKALLIRSDVEFPPGSLRAAVVFLSREALFLSRKL